MLEFLHVGRWGKRNRTDFYWVMLLMYTISEYRNIFPLDIDKKYFSISNNFDTVQIFFLSDFLGANVPKFIFGNI